VLSEVTGKSTNTVFRPWPTSGPSQSTTSLLETYIRRTSSTIWSYEFARYQGNAGLDKKLTSQHQQADVAILFGAILRVADGASAGTPKGVGLLLAKAMTALHRKLT